MKIINSEKNILTPLMKQYFEIKKQYPETIMFFQVGDFYEMFFDDAKVASDFLAIALTKRGKMAGKDIPLCGVPIHALNHYLVKLIRGGFKVAICDQIEKPQPGRVVKRKVTQVFTPGTLTDGNMLDEKSASYLFSFFPGEKSWGLVFTELLTAQIFATSIKTDSYKIVETELGRFLPDEVILPDLPKMQSFAPKFKQLGYPISFVNQDIAGPDTSKAWFEHQFNSGVFEKLQKFSAINSSMQFLHAYLKKNQESALAQLKNIHFYQPEDYLILDFATQKNLEIVKNSQDGSRKNTIFSVLDKAKTAMGSRTIKKWLLRPCIQKTVLNNRYEIIAALSQNVELLQKLERFLVSISDVERIVGRIALRRATFNDYLALKSSLFILPELINFLEKNLNLDLINFIVPKMKNFSALAYFLHAALNDDPSNKKIIKTGFDLSLDQIRELAENGQQKILQLEKSEIVKTKINSLKIRYNQVAGYYIEITKPNLHLVPQNYIQQQTLVNRARFMTEELRELQENLLKAQNELETKEQQVFDRVKNEVEQELNGLRQLAKSLCILDALFGFSKVAYDNNYVKPEFNDKNEIVIKQGRHAVVEQALDFTFVPNDTNLVDTESLWVITGPNMGGKSTYLRQVALICILAQAGSFVPAELASLPILDRIFTRIGSGDNLAQGKSTFLVEMEEAATICSMATKNSLVILDEVGRGTSTFDGMALAQAIIEYIYKNIGAKALFATHYHKLTRLHEIFPAIANYHMESKKLNDSILFLHKLKAGASSGSFGLQVAKLANLPEKIIKRATVLLRKMEQQKAYEANMLKQQNLFGPGKLDNSENIENFGREIAKLQQQIDNQGNLLKLLNEVDLDQISPKQAFDLLWDLKNKQKVQKS